MSKEAKRIPVRSDGPPIPARIPVELRPVSENPNDAAVKSERLLITPGIASAHETLATLHHWAKYFAPYGEQVLPSPERTFTPQSVSVERQVFYRNDNPIQREDAESRRVRVTWRRVTLFGTIR